jgi:anti-sigma B factor antagonist
VASAEALRKELADASERPRVGTVIVDLSAVTFIDSTGLGVLVGAARRLRAQGGDLQLVGCTTALRRVLVIAGLDHVFDLPPETAPD